MTAPLQPPTKASRDVDAELEWHDEIDPRRLQRVAEILADILDNAKPAEDGRRP